MKKALILMTVLCSMLLLAACKEYRYVEVPSTHIEYVTSRDTIAIRDSVYIEKYNKGDTLYVDRFKYKILYKTRVKDSIKVDTVTIVKEVVTGVNKSMNKLQGFLILVGICAILYIIIYVLIKYGDRNKENS